MTAYKTLLIGLALLTPVVQAQESATASPEPANTEPVNSAPVNSAPVNSESESANTESDATPVLDEVLVTGEQPGPKLWKVSKDGHALWILGTYGPLPKKVTWRSREVESIIAESQRVVRWVRIETDVDIGFFAGLAALPSLINAGNNPDGAKLKDVVTPEMYAQWLPLKEKYVGRDKDIEDLRPSFAVLQLRQKAQEEAGLSGASIVWPAVEMLARKHKVKVLEPEVEIEVKIEKPRAMIKKFRKMQLADVECFGESLARLEDDIDVLKARANAWAVGNLDVLRKKPPPDQKADCAQMLMDTMLNGQLAEDIGAKELRDRAIKQFEEAQQKQRDLWLQTVEKALQDNTSTLALAPIEMLMNEQSPLNQLRDRGYEIDNP